MDRNDGRIPGGPTTASVIEQRTRHRSNDIWNGKIDYQLRSFFHGRMIDSWGVLSDAQLQLVRRAGFGHYHQLTWLSTDLALVYALAEHFWPRTNTFHFPIGEMTITLEDVLFILGLRISGRAVTGQHRQDYTSVIKQLLGRDPPDAEGRHGKLSIKWLKQQFGQLPAAPTEFDIQCHTRAYLLALMGCTLFSDGSGKSVPAMLLPLLEDFDGAGEYAWGAATLAFLYRQLRNFARKAKTSLSGCLMLLQVWAHEHLTPGRPVPNTTAPSFPCTLRWVTGNRSYVDPHHDLAIYRQDLDLIHPKQVIWEPYIAMDRDVVGEPMLLTAREDSLVRSCIIYYSIVEFHPADRCLRQFGMQQCIPDAPLSWPVSHSQGVGVRDWEAFHEQPIRDWNDRFQRFRVHGELATDLLALWPSIEFRDWYGTPRVQNPHLVYSERRYMPKGYREEILDTVTLEWGELQRSRATSASVLERALSHAVLEHALSHVRAVKEGINIQQAVRHCKSAILDIEAALASLREEIQSPKPPTILINSGEHPIVACPRPVPRFRQRRRPHRSPELEAEHLEPQADHPQPHDESPVCEQLTQRGFSQVQSHTASLSRLVQEEPTATQSVVLVHEDEAIAQGEVVHEESTTQKEPTVDELRPVAQWKVNNIETSSSQVQALHTYQRRKRRSRQ